MAEVIGKVVVYHPGKQGNPVVSCRCRAAVAVDFPPDELVQCDKPAAQVVKGIRFCRGHALYAKVEDAP